MRRADKGINAKVLYCTYHDRMISGNLIAPQIYLLVVLKSSTHSLPMVYSSSNTSLTQRHCCPTTFFNICPESHKVMPRPPLPTQHPMTPESPENPDPQASASRQPESILSQEGALRFFLRNSRNLNTIETWNSGRNPNDILNWYLQHQAGLALVCTWGAVSQYFFCSLCITRGSG